MEYFFSLSYFEGSYKELVDDLLMLKLGKILGLDYKLVCIGLDSNSNSLDAYEELICGILTRGASTYVIRNYDKNFFKYLLNESEASFGIVIETHDEKIKVTLFNHLGEELDEIRFKEIEYLLKQNISFRLNSSLGKVLPYEEYLNKYNLRK